MGMVLSLIGAVQANAQCPTVMSVTQVASGCGADVTYAVTNTVGFQFIQFELDGTPISTQPSGTISLDPGTYTFAVSTADANNCTMYIEEEVTVVSPTGFSAFITVQATPCGGQCTGALMAGANGGTPPYTYMWSMANTTQVVDDLCEGFYTAWVTDANGCSAEASVNLAEAPPAVAFFNDTVACNGFLSIDMNTTGGTGDYSFAWTPADMMLDPTAEFPTMTVGTDTTLVGVTVTDNVTGCATTESLLVYPNVPIQATFELCNGSALLEVNPGSVMYNWSATDVDGNTIDMSGAQGQAAILALETGTYNVVTYYTGCNVTTHVFEVVACSVQCNSTINPSSTWTNCSTNFCFDAGGVPAIESYAWDFAGMYSSEAPSACFSQSLAGNYEVTLTATHVGGCISTSVVTVQANANGIEVNLPDDDGLIACNGTLFITPVVTGGSGDRSYLWEPTAVVSNPTAQTGNITVSAPEWVYVTVMDNVTGCMAEDSVYVSPNLPVNQTVDLCNGQASLQLNPGSMMYNWSATDPDGNTIDMSGASGNSFEATLPGNYVVMTYYSGCNVITHQFEVEECPVGCESVISVSSTPTNCNTQFCFTATGIPAINTYDWAFSSIYSSGGDSPCFEQGLPGNYDVTLTALHAGGCVSTTVITVEVIGNGIGVSLPIADNIACNGILVVSPIVTGGSGDYSYLWEPGSAVDDPTAQTASINVGDGQTVYVTVTDNITGCTVEDSLHISPNLPVNQSLTICNGLAWLWLEQGSESYVWTATDLSGSPMDMSDVTGNSFMATIPGNYVVVTQTSGCNTITHLFEVSVPLVVSVDDTVYTCSGVCGGNATTLASGGLAPYTYEWDSNGATTPTNTQLCAGMDTVIVIDANGCGIALAIMVLEYPISECANDVWPGDANSDGEATNTDALWVGLAFDQTGPIRPNATLQWEGQPAPDWNFNFAQNNVNLKHADTDGNGTVNFADTIAISQNYGQTHGKTENALGGYPMLWVEATPDTVGLSQAVIVTVHLADAAMPVDSLHGIAFTLTFEAALVTESGFSIDFSQNVLGTVGTDVLTLQQPFFANGEVDVAISRITLQNFSGHGPLMTARIVTTDNLSGYNALHLGLSGITAITATEAEVLLTTSPDTVVIDPDHVGVRDIFGPEFSIYPNPSTDIFQLEGLHGAVTVEVMDATGRTVTATSSQGNSRLTIDMSAMPSGIYLLRASNAAGVVVKRIELLGR